MSDMQGTFSEFLISNHVTRQRKYIQLLKVFMNELHMYITFLSLRSQ